MPFRIALAQCNPTVGDVAGNTALVLDAWRRAADAGADLVVASELVLTGYPPEDLLLKPDFIDAEEQALHDLAAAGPHDCALVLGHVDHDHQADLAPEEQQAHWDTAVSARNLHNAASVLQDGEVRATYRKLRLPNYGVFDEARYFTAADQPVVVEVAGVPVGITICEDMWAHEGPMAASAAAGALVVAVPNASPYAIGKRATREVWAARHAERDGTFVLYTNQVGGQDEVVFDGDSFVVGPDGTVGARGAVCAEDLVVADLDLDAGTCDQVSDEVSRPDELGET